MPSFNFSFTQKKVSKRKTSNDNDKYEVVEKNIIGVVFIDINANYYVKVNSSHYNIDNDCYSCKGEDRVYVQGYDDKHRVCIIRNVDEYFECNPNLYLPFAPGCVVSGNIVINRYSKAKVFYIKKVWIDLDNDDSHEALLFYKEHYKEINAIIVKRRCNGT